MDSRAFPANQALRVQPDCQALRASLGLKELTARQGVLASRGPVGLRVSRAHRAIMGLKDPKGPLGQWVAPGPPALLGPQVSLGPPGMLGL